MFPAGFVAGGRSASRLARRPPTAKPVPLAGRSDLTTLLSSDIFPHRWLKVREIGHGWKKIWEDVPEGIQVPEGPPAGLAGRGRSASGLARRPPTAKPVPPGGTLGSD